MKWLFWLILAASTALAQSPQFGGFLRLDKRFNTGNDSLTVADFYNRFRLEMDVQLGERLHTFSSLDFRFYDLPRVSSLKNLEDPNRVFPTNLSLWEAYLDVYGFLFKNFDLRLGKQRLAWGTADKLNPTDNLNPDDFSDRVNFTEKIPVWAAKGSYYLGGFTLTGIWLPEFTPILLPRNSASLFIGEQAGAFRDSLALPAQQPQNGMFAFKLSSSIGNWDYSISYFNGYDDIPILKKIIIDGFTGGNLSGRIEMGFPKIQVVGLDFATEIFGAGFWGEGALFFPEKVVSQTLNNLLASNVELNNTEKIRLPSHPFPAVLSNVELDNTPYFKFTLGGDYNFPGGFYLNGQWMHGFSTERGGAALQDYFIFRFEKKLFKDDVKATLGTGLEINQWKNLSNKSGYGIFPELTYLAIDNLELTVGAFIVGGDPGTLFGTWKNSDQAYLSAKVTF